MHISGLRKRLLYVRVALHVATAFLFKALGRSMPFSRYFPFLRRAWLFLRTIRHSKVVKLKGTYKLHLYLPAYPTPAFFRSLDKLHSDNPPPVTVVLSMTRACRYNCPHCYQKHDSGQELELSKLIETAREMQRIGVTMFDIEGGEPLLRFERLEALLSALDETCEPWINTTGDGLTEEKLARLKQLGLAGAMVSLHSPVEKHHDEFTGVKGSFQTALRALKSFSDAGMHAVVNCCPSPESVAYGELEHIFHIAHDANCSFVQVIHGKAAGGWLETDPNRYNEAFDILKQTHLRYNSCEKMQFLAASVQVFEVFKGVLGCTAGAIDRFYVGAEGEVQPCEFLNISFGSVADEPFMEIYRRMRQYFPCGRTEWLCCTKAREIAQAIAENGGSTPLEREQTERLVSNWDKYEPTPLYRKLGIYDR